MQILIIQPQDISINDLKLKTQWQSSNFNSTTFQSHLFAVNCYSTGDSRYGTRSIISNYQEILSIKDDITTQSADIIAIQAVNTTQSI
jgi:hypothetical protein